MMRRATTASAGPCGGLGQPANLRRRNRAHRPTHGRRWRPLRKARHRFRAAPVRGRSEPAVRWASAISIPLTDSVLRQDHELRRARASPRRSRDCVGRPDKPRRARPLAKKQERRGRSYAAFQVEDRPVGAGSCAVTVSVNRSARATDSYRISVPPCNARIGRTTREHPQRSPQSFDPYRQPVAGLRDRPHLPAGHIAVSKAHSCRRQ